MNEFEKQYLELQDLLKFEDFSILTKRIIDLTLDTEDISYYKKTNDFLVWLDQNETNVEGKKEKYQAILSDLHSNLSKKTIPEKKLLVATSDLVKSYGSSSFGLGPIALELHQGEILGLVGENGNGKTNPCMVCRKNFYTFEEKTIKSLPVTASSLDVHSA